MKVLFTEPLPALFVQSLQAMVPAGIEIAAVCSMAEEEWQAAAAGAEVLINGNRRVDAACLAAAPRALLVQRIGAGYDTVDLAAARQAGVMVANMAGANATAVAEQTILLILAMLKRLPQEDAKTRAGVWELPISAPALELADATVGLVGFGFIAQAVAERLRPFGTTLLYTARHAADSETERRLGAAYAELDTLLARSTILSLHVPLSNETRNLIGEAELARMPSGSYLVNTARGGVVDEGAVRRALESGHLAGAAFDTLTQEPGPNPFLGLPQAIVTPHMGGLTAGSFRRYLAFMAENVTRVAAGEQPRSLVPGSLTSARQAGSSQPLPEP